jgi:hypothetical protein
MCHAASPLEPTCCPGDRTSRTLPCRLAAWEWWRSASSKQTDGKNSIKRIAFDRQARVYRKLVSLKSDDRPCKTRQRLE